MATKNMSTLRLPNSPDVYEITDKKAREEKIDKEQGTSNAGKLMAVGTDGKAALVNAPVSFDATYDEDKKVLVLGGKSEIPGNVSVDPTLSESSTNAIQNQAVAKKTNEISTNVKSVKNDLDVLKARVDEITSLEEGSTSGDVELQDIRVGYDGTTYENAGEAVRQQVSELNGALVQLEDDVYYQKPSVNLFTNYEFAQLTVDQGIFIAASTLKGFYIQIEPNQTITIERTNVGRRFRFFVSSEKPDIGVANDTSRVIYVDDSSNKGSIYVGDNKYLYVVYYSTSLDTLTEEELMDGMKIYYGTEWEEAITKADRYYRYLNVKDFGAVGDGVTDDSDAIQSALDYCASTKIFRTIYFPVGTYMVSKTITIPSQIKIIGCGNASVIKLMREHNLTRYVWREEADDNDLSHKYRYPIVFTNENANYVVLENIVFSGDTTITELASECQSGLVLQGLNHCVRNCSFTDFNYLSDTESWSNRDTLTTNSPGFGLHIFNSNRIKIEHCYFKRNGYQGVGTDRSENVSFSDCYFGDANRTAFQLHQGAKNVSAINSVFDNQSLNSNIQLTFHGAPDDLIVDGLKVSNCQINGNIVDVLGYEHNIQFENCRHKSESTFTSGPTESGDIYGNAQGTPHNWLFTGCIFENVEGYYPKFSLKCDRLCITGNLFSTPNRNPILVNGGDTVMVSNNMLYIDRDDNGTDAINVDSATNALVNNNHIVYTS